MIQFILNNKNIETDLPQGMTVLDFVRYQKQLTGTKIGCREGDCGACTVLVGELSDSGEVIYRSMTSCLLPLVNVQNKHIVTVEGINQNEGMTPIQSALVEENGTQCGFCTVGFVMSLTGFSIQNGAHTVEERNPDAFGKGGAIAAIDGNICRCTGYKSIERAAKRLTDLLNQKEKEQTTLGFAIENQIVPSYFSEIKLKLHELKKQKTEAISSNNIVSGGTDLYVQKHDEMPHIVSKPLFDSRILRGVKWEDGWFTIGASATVTDLKESPEMNAVFPNLQKHLKLVSSTPIRNMATIAGNLVNASPIGDMTVFLLALNATIFLENAEGEVRELALKDFYKGYKILDKSADEILISIRFPQPTGNTYVNFEKVCKRTHLDIASVNTAISLKMEENIIVEAYLAVGGVAPIPLILSKTSAFLVGKNAENTEGWFEEANDILQTEISPISDVRGSSDYKRLLAKQLIKAHFEVFSSLSEGLVI